MHKKYNAFPSLRSNTSPTQRGRQTIEMAIVSLLVLFGHASTGVSMDQEFSTVHQDKEKEKEKEKKNEDPTKPEETSKETKNPSKTKQNKIKKEKKKIRNKKKKIEYKAVREKIDKYMPTLLNDIDKIKREYEVILAISLNCIGYESYKDIKILKGEGLCTEFASRIESIHKIHDIRIATNKAAKKWIGSIGTIMDTITNIIDEKNEKMHESYYKQCDDLYKVREELGQERNSIYKLLAELKKTRKIDWMEMKKMEEQVNHIINDEKKAIKEAREKKKQERESVRKEDAKPHKKMWEEILEEVLEEALEKLCDKIWNEIQTKRVEDMPKELLDELLKLDGLWKERVDEMPEELRKKISKKLQEEMRAKRLEEIPEELLDEVLEELWKEGLEKLWKEWLRERQEERIQRISKKLQEKLQTKGLEEMWEKMLDTKWDKMPEKMRKNIQEEMQKEMQKQGLMEMWEETLEKIQEMDEKQMDSLLQKTRTLRKNLEEYDMVTQEEQALEEALNNENIPKKHKKIINEEEEKSV